jgi:hypothetical protein
MCEKGQEPTLRSGQKVNGTGLGKLAESKHSSLFSLAKKFFITLTPELPGLAFQCQDCWQDACHDSTEVDDVTGQCRQLFQYLTFSIHRDRFHNNTFSS